MTDTMTPLDHESDNTRPQTGIARIADRRSLLARMSGVAAFCGLGALAACGEGEESPLASGDTDTPSPSATGTPTILDVTDSDLLILQTQLLYLQGEYYSRAVLGAPLPSELVTGTGTLGEVVGPRPVSFTDPVLKEMMNEIAIEKIDQIARMRAVLGAAAPARPALDLGAGADGVFARYGADAVAFIDPPVPPPIADVYADQEQFLLGAFLIEDPVMASWRGIATLMTDNGNIDISAGMLATSAAHAGLVRLQLYLRGGASGSTLRGSTTRLSDLRDSYAPVDDDRGVAQGGYNQANQPDAPTDITPADSEGEIYGRLPNLTINTYYMTREAAMSGGFFPSGLNGTLRESTANGG